MKSLAICVLLMGLAVTMVQCGPVDPDVQPKVVSWKTEEFPHVLSLKKLKINVKNFHYLRQ